MILKNLTFTENGAAAWPVGSTTDDFVRVARQALEDSYSRNSNFNEIATSVGAIFSETDEKMHALRSGIEGKIDLCIP